MQYGSYVQLLLAAQADTDPAHRQLAMDQLAIIGPMAGGIDHNGNCPGDALAKGVLDRLYPPAEDVVEKNVEITASDPSDPIQKIPADLLAEARRLAAEAVAAITALPKA